MKEMTFCEERPVRRIFHDEEWWFVLTDIVSALTDSPAPSDYLKKLRRRDPSLADALALKRPRKRAASSARATFSRWASGGSL